MTQRSKIARFTIKTLESTPEVLMIEDDGPFDKYPTITNSAREVVDALIKSGELVPGRKLRYYDSHGDMDEIVWSMERGFIDFADMRHVNKRDP